MRERELWSSNLICFRTLQWKTNHPFHQICKNLDEGNLVFPRTELIPFLRHVDNNVREFTCDSNLKRFPTKFLEMCRNSVLNNEELEVDFRLLIAALSSAKVASNCEVVDGLVKDLVSKLANTGINEFMNAKVDRDLKKGRQGCARR